MLWIQTVPPRGAVAWGTCDPRAPQLRSGSRKRLFYAPVLICQSCYLLNREVLEGLGILFVWVDGWNRMVYISYSRGFNTNITDRRRPIEQPLKHLQSFTCEFVYWLDPENSKPEVTSSYLPLLILSSTVLLILSLQLLYYIFCNCINNWWNEPFN
jgi:hypothetical protein